QRQLDETRDELKKVYEQEEERKQQERLATLRTKVNDLTPQAEKAVQRKEWENAKQLYRSVLANIESEQSDFEFQVDADRIRQDRRRIEEARKRLLVFRKARHRARFHETLLTGLDAAANRKETQAANREALTAFQVAFESGGELNVPARYYSQDEAAEVMEG